MHSRNWQQNRHLYSSCNNFDSLFTAPNTIYGFSLVPSNLAAKQTETQTFSCPVDFTGASLALVASTVVSETYCPRQQFHPLQQYCEEQNYIDVVIDVHVLQRILANLLNMNDLSVQLLFFCCNKNP